VFDGLTWVL
jgi:AP-1 complex subunit mu